MYVRILQDQQTPMHYAAQSNQIEIIKLLKNSGATVDAKDDVS